MNSRLRAANVRVGIMEDSTFLGGNSAALSFGLAGLNMSLLRVTRSPSSTFARSSTHTT
eukprot:CAMPEP_0114630830 /NCGR_PEP_ID=MMETSP0168-20121206/14094_1 /TAXON_ID=95228 ORGANISM="Vannella sp., Strain DIVA3 517/6/12" /NCGR_SAMPLE_ID=MMETSP0168 /ASSEMBLY_ACC=CAM_ASM_000044 /LENGTH=58 /DNA_ID=CAMNT_0001842367 /DNA_START=20 /DNA_END=192 /DNA_ORIENTATION=-